MTRLVTVSNILGANLALFAFTAGKLAKANWYVQIPLMLGIFYTSRNIVMRNCLDGIYYPLRPLYQNVWQEHGKQARTVKEVREINQSSTGDQGQDSALNKPGITDKDREKLEEHLRIKTEERARADANRELEEEEQKRKDNMTKMLDDRVHKYVNETDFQPSTLDVHAPGEA